jgi:DNA polymerase-3 subunit gamma/tau
LVDRARMTYQVLARKWRPKSFETLVGQEHVVRALSHALREGRLHHAYLFTGTRGVGKTTLARILAKALNCETGVSPTPCGKCGTCLEIDSGRFVDYIEMDAASNRGVDDMAQLLEQATYAPTRGRYKVYVIDEVHQLSGHAFNAMLKTLEEPPAHVKFILATTDPQKIPVTVLSRCLQFNLKQMPQTAIVGHLEHVLEQEGVPAEVGALRLIARAGAGSMRDSLSLVDQAIAHGAGRVSEVSVRAMLGTVDVDQVFGILDALLDDNSDALLALADALATRSLSFDTALQELANILVRIQVAQFSPATLSDEDPYRERIVDLAARMDPEFVQLAYQIAVQGRTDFPHAPEPISGFVMTLLRLLAFKPLIPGDSDSRGRTKPAVRSASASAAMPAMSAQKEISALAVESREPTSSPASPPIPAPAEKSSNPNVLDDWRTTLQSLKLSGMVRELAQHCELVHRDATTVELRLAPTHRHLHVKASQDKIEQALAAYSGAPLKLSIRIEETAGDTPARVDQMERKEKQDRAVAAIEGDNFVRDVIDLFDATLIESSIKPAN